MPQLWPRPFGSASVVLPLVVLGRPLPLFPLDVQQIAVLFPPNGVWLANERSSVNAALFFKFLASLQLHVVASERPARSRLSYTWNRYGGTWSERDMWPCSESEQMSGQ